MLKYYDILSEKSVTKFHALIFYLIPFCVKSQIYLPKYSYQITGVEAYNLKNSVGDLRITGGTVFFLEWKKTLFLVSAKHVFTGCEHEKKSRQPQSLQVWIPKMKKYYSVDNTITQDTATCADFGKDADILVIRVADSLRNYVNSVESYITNPFKKPGAIWISGFPKIYIGSHDYASDSAETKIIRSGKYLLKRAYNFDNSLDTFNFFVDTKEIKIDESLQGNSGSPVFFQKGNTKTWRIGAVVVGYSIIDSIHYMILCDFKYVLQKLKEIGYPRYP